jgi:hypothetical protein
MTKTKTVAETHCDTKVAVQTDDTKPPRKPRKPRTNKPKGDKPKGDKPKAQRKPRKKKSDDSSSDDDKPVPPSPPSPPTKPTKPKGDKPKGDKPKGDKPKRQPTAYAQFVKTHYDGVRSLPPRERFKKIGEMWRKQKGN